MNPKHIIESQQFTVPLLMELFERTRQMEKLVARGGTRDYEDKILATLFYRPSTRTRFSFEAAMLRLGGKVLSTEQAGMFSSAIPGERLEDTVRVLANDCDVIVLRHNEEGAAARAASVSSVPVINAGEGPGGQHPTQALLDLYTIYDECKTLDGLSVALVGALGKSRTARSLTYLLGKFARVRLYFVAPPQMQISADILAYLERHDVSYELADSPEDVLPRVDVVYQEAHRPHAAAPRHPSCHVQYRHRVVGSDETERHRDARPAARAGDRPACGPRPASRLFPPEPQRAVRPHGASDDVVWMRVTAAEQKGSGASLLRIRERDGPDASLLSGILKVG